MILVLQIWFGYLMRLPLFLSWFLYDCVRYVLRKGWKEFEGWGLHLYVGKFGAGKTCTMVADAYAICRRYPQLSVVTNLNLQNFPAHTNIIPLVTPQDILNAPENSLVLIDEIGTIFNSRDFSSSKQSVPKILFQHLCQCRKRKMMILATTQRWNFMDKQLRDIAATVRVTSSHFSHPFTRISTVRYYNAREYDLAYTNPLYPLQMSFAMVYIQTNKIRRLYDTTELIDSMLTKEYVSDAEILANRGELDQVIGEIDKKTTSRAKKNLGKIN